MKNWIIAITFILSFVLVSCTSSEDEIQKRVMQTQLASTLSAIPATSAPAPTPTPIFTPVETASPLPPIESPTMSPTPAATPTLAPDAWKSVPVLPTGVSQRICMVYKLGQMQGNNPKAFSKVGDCQSELPNFFGYIDDGKYNLGQYTYLQPVIDYFAGSFSRTSRATKNGLTASAVMVPLWNTWKDCGVNETPLDCEYRIWKPSIAIISLGTNDANGLVPFETTLRRVINSTLGHGIIPILATKADNAEGDNSINATIVRLAYEYEIPVWNFWLAVQPLPQHGLRSPEHLTFDEYGYPTDFSKPDSLNYAFNVRNLTALQALNIVWQGCSDTTATAAATPTP